MPVYELIAPTGTATLDHKAEISRAVTQVHSELTGGSKDELSIILYEVPGANCFEYGSILPEASQDHGSVSG